MINIAATVTHLLERLPCMRKIAYSKPCRDNPKLFKQAMTVQQPKNFSNREKKRVFGGDLKGDMTQKILCLYSLSL